MYIHIDSVNQVLVYSPLATGRIIIKCSNIHTLHLTDLQYCWFRQVPGASKWAITDTIQNNNDKNNNNAIINLQRGREKEDEREIRNHLVGSLVIIQVDCSNSIGLCLYERGQLW